MKEHISQKECLPVETKKDWGILTPQKDEKSLKNPMSDGIESKSDELSSKNRISVIAFRKQPNKRNSVKLQPDVEKVSTFVAKNMGIRRNRSFYFYVTILIMVGTLFVSHQL